jgi:hypothetical protein
MRWAVRHGGDHELLDLLRVESDRLFAMIGQCPIAALLVIRPALRLSLNSSPLFTDGVTDLQQSPIVKPAQLRDGNRSDWVENDPDWGSGPCRTHQAKRIDIGKRRPSTMN